MFEPDKISGLTKDYLKDMDGSDTRIKQIAIADAMALGIRDEAFRLKYLQLLQDSNVRVREMAVKALAQFVRQAPGPAALICIPI